MALQNGNITEMIEAFSGSTGIGLIYLDSEQQFSPESSAKRTPAELQVLDFAEVLQRLEQLTIKLTESGNYFETFFTEHRFIYNIHALIKNHSIHCYLLSEPMVIQPFSEQRIQGLCSQRNYSVAEKIGLTQILATLPVVSWHRIYQLGTVLNTLCSCALNISTTHQAVTDVHRDFEDTALMSKKIDSLLNHQTEIHPMEFNMYLKIKSIIQSGDVLALPGLEKSVNFGDLPFRRFGNVDFLRVVKDYFIFFCATEFYCAVEAGMPYRDMLVLLEKLIDEAEQMQQVNEVFTHMKLSMALFTQAVHHMHGQRYSKPVMDVLAYLRGHYSEKLTLEQLSAHVGHNPTYLSSIIKRETGVPLVDHINRIRIEESKQDLVNSNRSINDIAQGVGFVYQNHFARVFKKITGMTPLEYRDHRQHQPTSVVLKKVPKPNDPGNSRESLAD